MANRKRRSVWLKALGTSLVAFSFVALAALPVASQDFDPSVMYGADGSWAARALGGLNKPSVEPQGVWGEVIMANGKWIVLQNAQGQQFPISYEAIRQFVVRWPTRLDLAAQDAFFEVTGVDATSNQVRANHVDVFEGSAKTLVTPTMQRLFGANRVITPLDVEQMQIYGGVFVFSPAEMAIPPRIHMVGNLVGVEPMRIGVEGNNAIAVLPAPEGIDMTQVTLGSADFVRKGDMVYYIPEAAFEKSIGVTRLILYKTVFFRAFR
jgi:hypothetical protein